MTLDTRTPAPPHSAALPRLEPRHDSFVGVDSDGCVFDSMDRKQTQCFHPLIISLWGLEAIAPYVREAAVFVNLRSRSRGRNRFPCLLDVFDLLRARPEVRASGVPVPRMDALRRWIASGVPLGNATLAQEVRTNGDPEMALVLKWSESVNHAVARKAAHSPPFEWAIKGLAAIAGHSDTMVVSQTPAETLRREWDACGLTPYVRLIAGQEAGTKGQQIASAARGQYAPDRMLMIGDAPGDCDAARENGALFCPITPGLEEACWERLCREGYPKFLDGTFKGDYAAALLREFDDALPVTPPWQRR